MHDFFHVQPEEIKALNDGQARELIARLCKAQMRKNDRNDNLVEWGGDQRASDGGFDVFCDDPDGPNLSELLDASTVGLQAKAESFIPSKIPEEMAPKGVIREAICKLDEVEGVYAIASTKDDCSHSMHASREAAMQKVLTQHGLDSVGIKFLDVGRLKNWCEQFPRIVLWVKEKVGVSVSGWKPFGSWSHGNNEVDKFLLDESLRVLDRNSEAAISMAEAIDSVRRELASGGKSVRIVGLSGTGKTRFVQALFEQVETTTEEPLNTNWVIYTDLNYQPKPAPEAIAEMLVLQGKRSILVVDNCGAALHARLNEIVQSSRVDVLTIEYDVREDFAERTSFYHIKETGNDVIEDFLHSRFKTLSPADIGKVVQFSGGNFRVALSLASTATAKGQLAHLQDNELFSRLFDQGGQAEPALLKFAEALSLVYSFDTKDTGANSELAWLASIADCSVTELFGAVAELNDRGLLQRRGRWAAVLPHAIANRLARRAIKRLPMDRFLAEISKNPQLRIALSFSRRLGYLHDSLEAQSLVENLIDQDGRFSDFSSLSGSESTLFRNLAAANQEAALANIERFVEQVTSSDPRCDVNEASTLLYHLAYDEVHFSKAFDLLVRLRKHDLHHNGNQDDLFDTLKILFYPLGSGTIARPKAKHEKIESLLEGDSDDRMLAKTLLRAGLQTDNFENFFGYEFGAHSRGWGLHVGEDCEIEEWFLPLTKLAHDNGISNSTDSGEFRSIVADSFYGLFTNVGLAEECERLAVAFNRIDGWPKGWTAIKGTLKWAKLDEPKLKQLRRLAEQLQPHSLSNKIQARLLSQYSHCLKGDDDLDPMAAEDQFAKEIKALGRDVGKQPEMLVELLGQLIATEHHQYHSAFGEGVGETISDPRLVFDATDALPEEAANSGPVFYRGLVWSWSKHVGDEELEAMMGYLLDHTFWSSCFPVLQASVRFDSGTFGRLLASIKNGKIDIWHYSMLWHHKFIKSFEADKFFALLDELRKREKGDLVVADILSMLTHDRHEPATEYSKPVVEYSIKFLETISVVALERTPRSTTAKFVHLFEHGVLDSASDGVAVNILSRLLNFHVQNQIYCDESTGGFLHHFFRRLSQETLERIYSLEIGHGRKKRMCRVKSYLNRVHAIDCCSPEQALIWIDECENKFAFLMSTASLTISDKGQSSLIQQLVDFWPDKSFVIEALFKKLYPDGPSSGSLANIMRTRIQTIENLCSDFDGGNAKLLRENITSALESAVEREKEELARHRRDNERFE